MYSLNKICFFLYCYLITKFHDVCITTYIRYENKYTYLEHKDKIPKDGQEQLVQEKPAWLPQKWQQFSVTFSVIWKNLYTHFDTYP